MYKPQAKRRWGYWAMPILYDDQLVGKLDATADPEAGVLRVDAVHEDGRWTRAMRSAVDAEIDGLAGWLALGRSVTVRARSDQARTLGGRVGLGRGVSGPLPSPVVEWVEATLSSVVE